MCFYITLEWVGIKVIELIKFELKKIFSNKLIFAVAIGIAVFVLAYPFSRHKEVKEVFTGKEEIQALAEKYISNEYTVDDVNEIRENARKKYYNEEELTKEEEFLISYFDTFIKVAKDTKAEMLKDIESTLKDLKNNNKENTFEYNNLLKQKEMLSNLSKQESFYLGDWSMIFDFNVAATMKLVLLVLGLAGTFSSEYTSRVAYLNLSTKKGKTKLNTAKIISALIYSTLVFIFVSFIYHIQGFALGLPNGDKSASYIFSSIYNISINEYYIGTLALSYLGTITFALVIVLLSLLTKNILVSFGLPLAIYLVPDILILPENIMKYTYNINFTQLLKGKNILGEYITFDLFGNIVLYPYLIIIVGLIAAITMLIIYTKFSIKQTVV